MNRVKAMLSLFALAVTTAHAETYIAANGPPACHVDSSGKTHVLYNAAQHLSFKCTISDPTTCFCTQQHPTHHTGGCKQFESAALGGSLINGAGDCTDSGLTVTPPPTPVPWSGSNLANAVLALKDGEMIYLAAGTYNWDSEKVINGHAHEIKKTITIMGAGKGSTIIDGMTGNYRLMRLMYGAQVNLVDLTVQNCQSNGPGAVVFSEYSMCKVKATRVEFKNNKSVNQEGGVYGTQEGKFSAQGTDQIGEFIDCDFIDNEGNGGGGAANLRGTTTFTRCTFTGNQAGFGGAVQVRINESGVCTFEDCTFTNNKSTKFGHSKGGAFYVDRGTVKFIGTNSFSGNQASLGTGENNACAKGTRSDIAFENLPSTLSGSSCA